MDGKVRTTGVEKLKSLRNSTKFVVVVFGRGCYFPPSWVFMKTFVSVTPLIRAAGGAIVGVFPDERSWSVAPGLDEALPFPLICDATLGTHAYCAREMGLNVPIVRGGAAAAHFGRPCVVHHAVVAATPGTVVYRWRCAPSLANQGGASGFVPGEVVWRLVARRLATLSGGKAPAVEGPLAASAGFVALVEREGGAGWVASGYAPDDARQYGGRTSSVWRSPIFAALLLANGRGRRLSPFVFDAAGGGERVDSQSVKAYVRIFVVALVLLAAWWARGRFSLQYEVDALVTMGLLYLAAFVPAATRLFRAGGAYGALASSGSS